jgi:hypothetical protein
MNRLLHGHDYLPNASVASAKPGPVEEYHCHGSPLGLVYSCVPQYFK